VISYLNLECTEEKPLYVGRFYNYDNIKELNNNEDLIKNVAQKFNDMEPYYQPSPLVLSLVLLIGQKRG
jgi:uncharacterized membrane protein